MILDLMHGVEMDSCEDHLVEFLRPRGTATGSSDDEQAIPGTDGHRNAGMLSSFFLKQGTKILIEIHQTCDDLAFELR
jgi:hypothetical protein